MKYTLKEPCTDCPFRNDKKFPLRRAEEIVTGLLNNIPFSCHKTTTSLGRKNSHPKAQHCAGALILLEKIERPHQMMRICERIGMYDHTKLKMDAPVYDSPLEFIEGCEE